MTHKMFNSSVIYCGFLFCLIINMPASSGYDTFFPLSMVEVGLPIIQQKSVKPIQQLDIAQFAAISMKPNTNTSYTYLIENSDDGYLKINETTGDVWINTSMLSGLINQNTFIISAKTSTKNEIIARMTLTLKPTPTTTYDTFCMQHSYDLCFWNSVMYSTMEGGQEQNKIIGYLGPIGYLKLCPNIHLEYTILNGSDLVSIRDGILYTSKPFDHDTFNPGPNLNVKIKCRIRDNIHKMVINVAEQVLHITTLDRNDNPPVLQDNKIINIHLDDPHFIQNNSVGHQAIIFLDDDSMASNSHTVYEILNDTNNIFQPYCTIFHADHKGLNTSVLSCKLLYRRSGILDISPYCFLLQARDETIENSNDIKSTNATICITTDTDKVYNGPTALALRSAVSNPVPRKNRNRKSQVYLTAEDLPGESSRSAMKSMIGNISYPSDITVYKTSPNMTRIAQPDNMMQLMNESSITFKLTVDPIKAFDVTAKGGIIYVKDVEALNKSLDGIYFLTVSWQRNTATVKFKLSELPDNSSSTCPKNATKRLPSCAERHSKKDCIKFCGMGADSGKCQWRSNNITASLTVKYATCSPDLKTCPDKICDPLEELGHVKGVHLCPQDCTTHAVGPANLNSNRVGIYSGNGYCSCDEFAKCSCGFEESAEEKKTKNKNKRKDVPATTAFGLLDTQYPTNISAKRASFEQFHCGPPCLALVVGCPLLLIIIIVTLLFTRRRFMKKCKRKLANGETANGGYIRGDGTDTEIINVEIPLVQIPNQEFKCDVDPKWEFPRDKLKLDAVLGEGEFGKVLMGYASDIRTVPGITTVAVKMLKTGANSVELLALLSEYQLLQEVSHPNIIRLLGVCTQCESPLLILEYAHHGSLRNYLRLSRKLECAGIDFSDGVEPVTVRDILSFAWQICKGMAYLTDIKLVHRDLAARNVLLAKGKICKISDFGLTRDVYEDDAYLKRSKDRVPVKWMAPESLADHVYTNRSDVWAFGVLTWELVTLGAIPYPGIPPQNLYHLLKTGYRMERPDNCSEEIYSIIRSCWGDDPGCRPSFKSLALEFEKLLGRNAKYLELEHSAVSNPSYCDDQVPEKVVPLLNSPVDNDDPENLDHLWHPPHMHSRESGEIQHELKSPSSPTCNLPPGYDAPRPLIDTKTIEQKLRYENDLNIPLKVISQPNLAVELRQKTTAFDADDSNLPPGYSHPVKRNKSYIDMAGEMGGIHDNLDIKNVDKESSKGKDITFRFSSLLHLNEQMSSAM